MQSIRPINRRNENMTVICRLRIRFKIQTAYFYSTETSTHCKVEFNLNL